MIQLKKDGNNQELYYENDKESFELPLEKDEYVRLFQKIQPNFAFSTADKLVQDNITDGTISPSYLNGNLFENEQLVKMIENAKKEMNYLVEHRNKKKRQNIKGKTKKKRKSVRSNKKNNKKNKTGMKAKSL